MSELRINNITDTAGSSGPIIAGVSTVTSTSHMVMPSGPTEMRGGRGTAITLGGYADPSARSQIDKMVIATAGNATDFGDISVARYEGSACGSATRGFLFGGLPSTFVIDYVTFSSSGGGAADFGNLRLGRHAWNAGANDSVRGFVMGGSASPTPTGAPRLASIEVITMATTGDTSDFGDLTKISRRAAGFSSPTRAIHVTGRDDPARTKDIQFFTMATKGNAVKFGEATDDRDSFSGAFSSPTRGVYGGGQGTDTPSTTNAIEFITIASEGNAQDFGDLTVARMSGGGASSKVRGLFCGGYAYPGSVVTKDEIDFVTIASTGNATDFGNLTTVRRNMDACSDVNGGLGD